MQKFIMCSECSREYYDPSDRRYHAQPISCPNCGPSLVLTDHSGCIVNPDAADPAAMTANLIDRGYIVAVKGIGGYHLLVNANDRKAVQRLRSRKDRDQKPFALMVRSIDDAGRYCELNESEKILLLSWKSPIVLLRKLNNCTLPEEIAPDNNYLGIMLPYTPLHNIIFSSLKTDAVIATSANISSEPVFFKDAEAFQGLQGIADYILAHDREIHMRADDSVTRVFRGREYIQRRSRGYAPMPLLITKPGPTLVSHNIPTVLACGGHLKNTFCININDEFFPSHHIGDLENVQTLESYEEAILHYIGMLQAEPGIIAYDAHPDYLSTRFALEHPIKNKIKVQHHVAHIVSCMADNHLSGEIIGAAFDGTGYGSDGNLWGGEFFYGDCGNLKRAGHFEYMKMPGGDTAVKEPWRMSLSCIESIPGIDPAKYLGGFAGGRLDTVERMLKSGFNCPLTSSVGRLFDAVSVLLGFTGNKGKITYEGQAAMKLEYIANADESRCGRYGYEIDYSEDVFIVRTAGIIAGILSDLDSGTSVSKIALKFHETLAAIVVDGCRVIKSLTGMKRVALSGGVFQNVLLLERCISMLESDGFKVYIHGRIPANDAGISLGQAVSALHTTGYLH